LADVKGVSFDEIARITTENARRCYWKMDHATRPAQVG
jgi:TatD DNase family protein